MPHLSSTASDPLSRFQQFNWSLNIFPEADTPPPTKTAGSSALKSLSHEGNEPVALSPIGSQCYSNQSSLSTISASDSTTQVGGSAQLRQSSSVVEGDVHPASSHEIEPEKPKDPSPTIIASPSIVVPESNKSHPFRSSPLSFCKQNASPTSSSGISPPSTQPSSGPLNYPDQLLFIILLVLPHHKNITTLLCRAHLLPSGWVISNRGWTKTMCADVWS